MRKIEKKVIEAIIGKKSVSLGNTSVEYRPAIETSIQSRIESSRVFLHGNHIATVIHATGKVVVNEDTLSAYPTVTTKSRLRALGVNVYTRKGVTYLDDKPVCDWEF